MKHLSQRVQLMAPSATMVMNQRTRDLELKGVNVINLSVGEPDFPTPQHIKDSAINAINDNLTFYPPAAGFSGLREAIALKLKNENDLDYSPNDIIVTVGAKNALAYAILALVDKGDEVIIPAPYWVTYAELVKVAEGNNVVIKGELEHDFKVTPEQIEKAITKKTKAILLCSPSNPTGSVYSYDEMKAIAEVLEKHPHVYAITDEIYEHINFVGQHVSLANFEAIKDRVIVINGVSKAYAMTGWRIGYMAGPDWIIKASIKLQGQFLTGATTISQKAAETALRSDQSCVKEMNQAFLRRRDLLLDSLKTVPGLKYNIPQGAFYVFPEISSYFGKSDGKTKINSATDFCVYLLENAHVGTVPGEAFGDPNCFRISYATSDSKLIEAIDRISNSVNKLK